MSVYIGDKKYCAVKKIGVNNQDIVITSNGNYAADEGFSGFGVVRVKVPQPIFDELNVVPKTTPQELLPLNDGFSKVTVDAVTATIDPDIKAQNIKKGIEILGVTGTLDFVTEPLTINPSTSLQEKLPTKDGFSKVTVNPVTANIDSNIIASNILKGVEILGVTGTVVESNNITTRNITSNGTFNPEPPYTGFSSVVVDVKAELEPLVVTPKVTQQKFTSADDYHGYSPVTVNAVTAAIDKNIKPENIKAGITILGVEGAINFEELTVQPQITPQDLTPSAGVEGFSKVHVNPVTAAIDPDIVAGNILKGVNILGVDGSIEFEETTLTATTAQQIITPTTNGFSKVTLNPVTAAIDADIKPENIKKGINILGVDGTLQFTTETLTVTPTTSQQIKTPTANGYSKVTVNAVTAAIDPDIKATNIRSGVNILGVAGTLVELKGQKKTVTQNGVVKPDSGYNALTEVTVNVNTVKNQDKTIKENGVYTPDPGFTGFGKVTVDVVKAINKQLDITPKTTAQSFTPPAGFTGFTPVKVSAVTSAIDANIKPQNILSGITILGVKGTAKLVLQEKHVKIDQNTPTIVTYTPDQEGCNGYSKFVFDLTWLEQQLRNINAGDNNTPVKLQNKTVTKGGTYKADAGYDGLGTVTVDVSAYETQIADLQARIEELEAAQRK